MRIKTRCGAGRTGSLKRGRPVSGWWRRAGANPRLKGELFRLPGRLAAAKVVRMHHVRVYHRLDQEASRPGLSSSQCATSEFKHACQFA